MQCRCTVDDDLWAELSAQYRDEAILELLMLAGTYRTVSYLVNSLRLPLEPDAQIQRHRQWTALTVDSTGHANGKRFELALLDELGLR